MLLHDAGEVGCFFSAQTVFQVIGRACPSHSMRAVKCRVGLRAWSGGISRAWRPSSPLWSGLRGFWVFGHGIVLFLVNDLDHFIEQGSSGAKIYPVCLPGMVRQARAKHCSSQGCER